MVIEFILDNENNLTVEEYINKPVTKDDKPVGVITRATIIDNSRIKIKAQIWGRYVGLEESIIGDRKTFNSMEINIG